MASTQLQMTNRLLRRLREDQVTGTTFSQTSQLVAEFLCDAYEFVNDAHMWVSLTHTVKVDIVPGTTSYDLTRFVSAGGNVRNSSTRVCLPESELVFIQNQPQLNVYADDAAVYPYPINFVEPGLFDDIAGSLRDNTAADPWYCTIRRQTSGSTSRLFLQIYPIPTVARVFEIDFITYPTLWQSDGTTDAVEILIPERPVYLYALMTALNERGEEIGEPGNIAERNFTIALGVAIEKDMNIEQRGDKYDWERV